MIFLNREIKSIELNSACQVLFLAPACESRLGPQKAEISFTIKPAVSRAGGLADILKSWTLERF